MEYHSIQDEIRDWMFDQALPFWASAGTDRQHGGFIEELTYKGEDARLSFKRTRVACRQMYVFSHALLLGWSEGRDLIAHGGRWLTERAWTGDSFVRRTTREGEWLDPTPDLYDHAFALFGFAWAYRATGDAVWSEWAGRTLAVIENRFAASTAYSCGEGYLHELPPKGWRLQNPHMHLLEACIAALEATGDECYRDRALEVVGLFEKRFFQASTGALAEYFTEDWTPAAGDAGKVTEPGHQLEWVWILHQCQRVLGLDLSGPMVALAMSAERNGVDPASGAVRNAIDVTGEILDGGGRTWPNAERVKAGVALSELKAAADLALPASLDPLLMIQGSTRLLFDRHLAAAGEPAIPPGGWRDAFDAQGRLVAERMPTSTLYHVFLAFAEVLRAAATTRA